MERINILCLQSFMRIWNVANFKCCNKGLHTLNLLCQSYEDTFPSIIIHVTLYCDQLFRYRCFGFSFNIYLFIPLWHKRSSTWHAGSFFFSFGIWTLSYCIRDLVPGPGAPPCIGSVESEPLDHQENPWNWPPSTRVKALREQEFCFSFCSQMYPGHLEQCLAHNSHLTCIYFGEGNGNSLQWVAWKIPWTEESGGLESMGSQRVRQDWATDTIMYLLSGMDKRMDGRKDGQRAEAISSTRLWTTSNYNWLYKNTCTLSNKIQTTCNKKIMTLIREMWTLDILY